MPQSEEPHVSQKIRETVETMNQTLEKYALSASLEENIALMESLFKNVDILVKRPFENEENPEVKFCAFFCDGVVDSLTINTHILLPLLRAKGLSKSGALDKAERQILITGELKREHRVRELVEAVTYGDTLLFIDGSAEALVLNSKGFSTRGISEPEGEKTLSGPREGFSEALMQNLSLIRRRLRTNDLKMRFHKIGERSATQVCVCYLDGVVNLKILKEFYRRFEGIKIDGVLDSNYIAEHIAEPSFLGFSATGITERPDVVAAKLLEGRIAILVDGTPAVLTLPRLFVESFQSNEDYYLPSLYSSFSRILRAIGFFFSVSTPAIYLAVVAFHYKILPPSLMVTFMTGRESVPLPASLEAVLMLLIFDILRETGVRMPTHVGHALSVIGGLVIGQAAVEAKLIAAPMVIVVAFTGITGLLVPSLSTTVVVCRYLMLALAATFGFFGVVLGLALLFIHILNLQSFGIPQFTASDLSSLQDVKDTFIRAPWPLMLTRPPVLTDNRRRQNRKG